MPVKPLRLSLETGQKLALRDTCQHHVCVAGQRLAGASGKNCVIIAWVSRSLIWNTELVQHHQDKHIDCCCVHADISCSVQALARMGYVPGAGFLDRLVDRASSRAVDISPKNMGNFLWALNVFGRWIPS